MNKSFISIGALLAALVLFFAVNIAGSSMLRGVRADLTQGHMYTLSQGSRSVAGKLQEPIRLTLYYSEKAANDVPQIKSYAARVKEILHEFERASGGKLRLDIVNPEPFSEAQDRADAAGLVGAPIGRGVDRLYFGLVGVNSTDKQETIPFFDMRKESFLEYDLTRMIYLLSDAPKKTVGVMSWLPVQGMPFNPMTGQRGGQQPWQIIEQMKELFEVKTVEPGVKEIPADINVLVVIHPKSPSIDTQYALDQFVLRGGRLLMFVDPLCEVDVPPGMNPMQAMNVPKASDVPTLFKAWGLELHEAKVAADRSLAMSIPTGSQTRPELISVIAYLQLEADNLAKDDPITGSIGTVRMVTSGVLAQSTGATTAFEPLVSTSDQAAELNAQELAAFPNWKDLLAKFEPGKQPLVLAARVTGKVKSAFPDGPPRPAPPAEGQPPAPERNGPHLAESTEPINVIVFADCDMLRDEVWVQPIGFGNVRLGYQKTADNGDLVFGAVDNLGGSGDVMNLRSRGTFSRKFDRVEGIQKQAEQQYAAKEKELQDKLRETESEINKLQQQRPDGQATMFLTPEQQTKLEEFQKERVETRKQLRRVQLDLRKDIERLGNNLKIANMALMPGIVALVAVGVGAFRSNRRRADRSRSARRT
ncbi:MAG: Gldg family protein [Phycisphaerales bacterium]|nr:Gldg family protein [Phycisphaerales bacterium]